jgi:hypothetical protein
LTTSTLWITGWESGDFFRFNSKGQELGTLALAG